MMQELVEKAKNILRGRQMAYQNIFHPESVAAKRVLADLAHFCRANESTFHPNPQVQAELEGRREVWLRIQHFTKLDPEQLWKVYGKKDAQ